MLSFCSKCRAKDCFPIMHHFPPLTFLQVRNPMNQLISLRPPFTSIPHTSEKVLRMRSVPADEGKLDVYMGMMVFFSGVIVASCFGDLVSALRVLFSREEVAYTIWVAEIKSEYNKSFIDRDRALGIELKMLSTVSAAWAGKLPSYLSTLLQKIVLPTAAVLNGFWQSPLFNHHTPPSSHVAHDLPFHNTFLTF